MIAIVDVPYDWSSITVSIGHEQYVVTYSTGMQTTAWPQQIEPSATAWASNHPIRPWGPPFRELPRKLPRDPFFPSLARAPLPQHRPKQAPPRPAHVRAYQRHREARTRPERCS